MSKNVECMNEWMNEWVNEWERELVNVGMSYRTNT